MYTSFEIENFRCFNRLKVDKLARINLITGKNNSGKTSLLEALWLHAAPNNPMLTLRLNHIRGIKEGDYNSEELWGWLFHKKQTCRPAVLRGTESDSEPRRPEDAGRQTTVKLTWEVLDTQVTSEKSEASEGQAAIQTSAPPPGQLAVERTDSKGQSHRAEAHLEEGKIKSRFVLGPQKNASFIAWRTGNQEENSRRFSKLRKANRHEAVIESIKPLVPGLEDLEVMYFGDKALLHADMGQGEPVPAPFLGDGVNRLLTFVLATAAEENSLVLIDEVDAGIHHEALAGVFLSLANMAETSGAQIFATTHSWECIEAACKTSEAIGEPIIALHRLEREEGESHAYTLEKSNIEFAVNHMLEVR